MSSVPHALRHEVEVRASYRCEYCRIYQQHDSFFRFHVDHILARQHRGKTELGNLALACHFCNRHKGPNIAAVDPVTKKIVTLFHPRKDGWDGHFREWGRLVEGTSATGRATVELLRMNAPNRLPLRRTADS